MSKQSNDGNQPPAVSQEQSDRCCRTRLSTSGGQGSGARGESSAEDEPNTHNMMIVGSKTPPIFLTLPMPRGT